LAAAFRIPEQLPLVPKTSALVLGDGRLGNLCAQVLALHGCRVEVVGKHLRKLQRLAELGLATCRLGELDPARRFPLVVDCTGSPSGLATALAAVEPQGTVVLKTTVAGPHQLPLAPVVIDEVRVLGSRCGPF
ncbi:MAG: zinc-binding dehydrogenase, partial [Planctomycetaceae bacterium]